MKKITLFIASLFVAMAMFAEIKVDTLWTNTSAPINEMKSGIGYLNGELLVPSIESPNGYIYVYDAATGQPKTNADQSRVFFDSIVGFRFDDLKVNDIDVVNGHVYAFNGGVNTHTRLYHWSSKDAEPVRYGIDGDISTLTTGFDIKVDENGNGFFFAVRRDGKKQTYATVENYEVKGFTNLTVDLTALGLGAGSGNAVDIVNDSTIWIDNANTTPILFRFNKAKGEFTKLATLTSDLFGTTTGAGIEQFSVKGYNYLAVATCNHGTYAGVPKNSIVVYQLNDDYTITPVTGYLPAKDLYGYASTNGTNVVEPTVVIENDVVTIYHVGANGGMAAHKLSGFPENSGVIEVTTMAELKANEGKRVLYKGLEPAVVAFDSFWGTEYEYYMPDGETALIHELWPVPAKMDVYGTLTENGFAIEEVAQIYAFYTFADLQSFFYGATEDQKVASYEIVEPFTVTLVNPMGYYYVQYEVNMGRGTAYMGIMVQMGGGFMPLDGESTTPYVPAVGDQVKLKGVYVPAVYDEDDVQRTNAMFMQESATLVSKNNEIKLFDFASYGIDASYDGAYGKWTGGNIVEKDGVYTYELDVYGEILSVVLQRAGNVDLTKYEPYLALCGVLVFDAYSQGFTFLAAEIKDTRLMFDNIAALLATEQTADNSSQMWYLKNSVAVTAVVQEKGLFIEDATGALFLDQEDSITTLAVGDSIIGVGGYYNPRQTQAAPQLTVDLAAVTVLSSNNTLVPTEVTIAELLEEKNTIYAEGILASTWANRLVTIKNVTTALDPEDEKGRFGWFIQEGDSLFYSALMLNSAPGTNEWVTSYGYTFYEKMNLTGIVDFACLNPNYEYSFFPRSQADIEKVGGTVKVENVKFADIYTENGLIVVDGEFQIFTTTGQNVTDMNGNLPAGVYVVRTATSVGKVVVK